MKQNIILKARKNYSRIDHFLKDRLADLSRTKIEQLIKNRKILLNSKLTIKKNQSVSTGDTVKIEIETEEKKLYQPSLSLQKIHEDEFLLIINKPPGINTHPGAGKNDETILDIFKFYYPQIGKISDTIRPGIVHRLDKETSGILILAKDEITMKRMQKKFKRNEIIKTYLALVSGKMRFKNGIIKKPLIRDTRNRKKFTIANNENLAKAREALTEYSVIYEFNNFSYLRIHPQTGRTHQIRVHLSYSGNSILGDSIYGRKNNFSRLALHAYSIEFQHPSTNNRIYSYAPIPVSFKNFLKKEALR